MRNTKYFATFLTTAVLVSACPAENVSAVPTERMERTEQKEAPAPPSQETVETLYDFSDAIAQVSERAVPSVVNISTRRTTESRETENPFRQDPFFRHFFDFGPEQRRPQQEQSLGSGVVVRRDGTILTNNHVVQGADEIRVTLADK